MIVKKRNGNMVAFDKNKIIVAIQKAMLEVNINTDRAIIIKSTTFCINNPYDITIASLTPGTASFKVYVRS